MRMHRPQRLGIRELRLAALVLVLIVAACSNAENRTSLADSFGSAEISRSVTPSLESDAPIVVGSGSNSVKPSGESQIGIDATDSVCRELKRDLEKAITETLSDLRDAGMPSEYMPSRSDLKKELSSALRANGCSGF